MSRRHHPAPRGTAVALLALLVSGALSGGAPAAVAAPADRDALVIDMVTTDPAATAVTYDSAGQSPPVIGPGSVPGSLRLTRPLALSKGAGLEVLPADGAQLAVGRYDNVAGQWGSGARSRPVVRLLDSTRACTSFVSTVPSVTAGWLDVKQISYDAGGAITSLAADYQMRCSTAGGTATGSIRFHDDLAFGSAGSTATYLDHLVAGAATPVTALIANQGSQSLALGAPVVVDAPTAGASLVLAASGEDCSQAPLAPGASCSVHLDYRPNAAPGGDRPLREARLSAPGLLRGYVSLQVLTTSVVYPPTAPVRLTGDEAYDGVRLRWALDGTPPDGWKVRRVDGDSRVLLATLPSSTLQYVDLGLAKGEHATYEVSAYNAAGEATAPSLSLTRPNLDDPPVAVARQVLAIEDGRGSRVSSQVVVTRSPGNPEQLALGDSDLSLTFPRLPATPGTYTVGPGQSVQEVGVRTGSQNCDRLSGSVDVRQAWISADLTVSSLDADFHLSCGGSLPVEAQVRIGVDAPVTALTTTGSLQGLASTVGETPDRRSLQVSNDGGTAVTLGTASVTGQDAGAFSVDATACPSVLAPADACPVVISFAPTRAGSHVAILQLSLGTAVGRRTLDLAGEAIGPPPVTVPSVQPVLGRVLLHWNSAGTGGSPLTAQHVLRAAGDLPFAVVEDLDPSVRSWIDTGRTPGATYRYQIVTDNRYGSLSPGPDQTVRVTVPREELVASVDTGAGAADLASLTLGAESSPVPLVTGQDTDEPAVSPDGRQVVYVVLDADGHSGLWLRNLDEPSQPRRLVDDLSVDEVDPTWSPDGTTVAYTRGSSTRVAVWTVAVAGGSGRPLAGGAMAANPSYLPDGSAVVVTDLSTASLGLASISTSGSRAAIVGTSGGRSPSVSPRGDRVAYMTSDRDGYDHVWLSSLTGQQRVSITSTFGNAYDRVGWSPDGAGLAVNEYGPYGGYNVTLWHDVIGSTPAGTQVVRGAAGNPVHALSWRRQDVSAPVVTFPGARALTAGQVRVPVSVVDDTTPVGGLAVTCLLDGETVERCAGGMAGIVATGRHTLKVTAADEHGHSAVASWSWTADATAPTVTVAALTPVVLSGSVSIRYSAQDGAGVRSYDVRYRRATSNATSFSAVAAPTGWSGTTATSRSLTVAPGYAYCFSVRARDALGNLSAWSAEQCASSAVDDRSLTRSGFTATTGAAYFLATAARSTVQGATLTLKGMTGGRQLYVVVTACPTCGSLDVLVGSTRLGTVSTHATTTVNRKVIALPASAPRTGTVVLRVTSSGKPVIVDGVAIRR